jgi:hypothetical protein
MKKFVLFLLIAATIAAVGTAYAKAREAREAGLRADSLEAAADTARLLHLAQLGDSTNAWTRRVLQVELERDSLDRELDARPVIRVAAGIRIDTVRVLDTVEVVKEDSVETYSWEGADGPFHVSGHARIFLGRGLFDTRVTVPEPVQIGVRIVCRPSAGIQSSEVLLTAPDPFHVVPGLVEQDPGICNPPVPPIFSFNMKRGIWAGVGFGVGLLVAHWLDDDFHAARY